MRRLRTAVIVGALLCCAPERPDLERTDVFADRVQTEALRAQWISATEGRNVKPKPFGVMPLLWLTESEIRDMDQSLHDPERRRCLRAIHDVVVLVQSESDPDVAKVLTQIVPLRDRIPDLSRMFTDEADVSRRKAAWLSQAAMARELAPLLRQLIEARNQWSLRHSGTRYVEFMRNFRGYDATTADRLEAQVRQTLASMPVAKSHPWDYEFIDPVLASRMSAKFDAAHNLERAAFVFQWLGLPEHPPALQIGEPKRTGFSSFAFYAIDPPAEQGITVRPGAGIAPHWAAFHEFGHAAMSLLTVRGTCRTSRRPISPAVSESCAKITERLFYSEEWLQSQGVAPEDIHALRDWERQSERMRMRSILADMEFERALYRNPKDNVMRDYAVIERKTAGVEIDASFPAWSLSRTLAFEPLARGDYLLARCAQAALYRRLRAMPGGLLGDEARRFAREQVFRGATELRYEEWFRKITGETPNCTAWLEDVAK